MQKAVCIFCGAKSGNSTIIRQQAEELCDLLIAQDFNLIYGGGKSGLMGLVADKFLAAKKNVIGVRPKKLIKDEDAHIGLTSLIVTEDMQDRKAKMIELADLFIALPGGTGTLDEVIETYTMHKIGFINKPSGILNTENYYEGLESLLNRMVQDGFLERSARKELKIAASPKELLQQLIASQ